jgi:potassium/chloride transporter 4/5/6
MGVHGELLAKTCSLESEDGCDIDVEAGPPTDQGEEPLARAAPACWEAWGWKLNQIIHARSKRAELVVVNLPDLWSTEAEEVLMFMAYCDTLTRGLERVLFVHSTGHEIFDVSG